MSPEQVLAEPVTERTDVYALGILGYELLTGDGPYQVDSPRELMAAHLRDTPRKLSSMRADVDAELERLLEECLDKDPAKRPTSAEVEGRLRHGASILLEWPPPGLEGLRARFERGVRVLGLGGALVGVPLVVLSVFDRESYVRQLLPPIEFVLSIVTLGVIVFARGSLNAIRFFRGGLYILNSKFRGRIVKVDIHHTERKICAAGKEYQKENPLNKNLPVIF